MIRGNVLDELLRCDLVLGCIDSQNSRAALSDYATHYLLPCIDSAALMRAKRGKLIEQVGEFARYMADEPCAWCLGRINQKVLWYELMTDEERENRKRVAAEAVERGIDGEQYWGGEPPKELTVGYMTTAVGAIQAGFVEGWITAHLKSRTSVSNSTWVCRCSEPSPQISRRNRSARATEQRVGAIKREPTEVSLGRHIGRKPQFCLLLTLI